MNELKNIDDVVALDSFNEDKLIGFACAKAGLRHIAIDLVNSRGGLKQIDDDEVIQVFMTFFRLTERDILQMKGGVS